MAMSMSMCLQLHHFDLGAVLCWSLSESWTDLRHARIHRTIRLTGNSIYHNSADTNRDGVGRFGRDWKCGTPLEGCSTSI